MDETQATGPSGNSSPPESTLSHEALKHWIDSPEAFFNRELSWLAFARRVLELMQDPEIPLLERVNFAGIVGMLHDEFFMKRIGGLKRQVRLGVVTRSIDGRTPFDELSACRDEIKSQMAILSVVMEREIRPALKRAGVPLLDHAELSEEQQAQVATYFDTSILPLLTPLAVDAEHPFPFISGQGVNLAIWITGPKARKHRFVRLKVPANHSRWLPIPGSGGFVPLEQVIVANLPRVLPGDHSFRTYLFRVTRGAEARIEDAEEPADPDALVPGGIVSQVTHELKARRFAGIVRLKVGSDMPPELRDWLCEQLRISGDDVLATDTLLGLNDLMSLRIAGHDELRYPPHDPVIHPRLRGSEADEIFKIIRRGDILLHHPYDDFDSSVLRFIERAAEDPHVLAIKITIYRTSSDSPIIRALAEAARRGKQVAVLVEITARFDEAPNIAWGQLLEKEGVHVAYGVEKLKTHVKLALVVREEQGTLHSYAHVGTGNYHTGTARMYEDLGILTSDPILCRDISLLFNQLTGALPVRNFERLIVAPTHLREHLIRLIRREKELAQEGKRARIRAKINQLQDPEIIRELYLAGSAGVEISLQVRGVCCLRPGVAFSHNIQVFSVVGRFLEHSRIYEFWNGGAPDYLVGSADWTKRNLDRRVESLMRVMDPELKRQLGGILDTYENDRYSRWDCLPDGTYRRRKPGQGEARHGSQEVFIDLARFMAGPQDARPTLRGGAERNW